MLLTQRQATTGRPTCIGPGAPGAVLLQGGCLVLRLLAQQLDRGGHVPAKAFCVEGSGAVRVSGQARATDGFRAPAAAQRVPPQSPQTTSPRSGSASPSASAGTRRRSKDTKNASSVSWLPRAGGSCRKPGGTMAQAAAAAASRVQGGGGAGKRRSGLVGYDGQLQLLGHAL